MILKAKTASSFNFRNILTEISVIKKIYIQIFRKQTIQHLELFLLTNTNKHLFHLTLLSGNSIYRLDEFKYDKIAWYTAIKFVLIYMMA